MPELAVRSIGVPAMTEAEIDNVRAVQTEDAALPQVALETQHLLHAGLYLRTIRMPAGVRITGALVRIATAVIVQGDCWVWLGDRSRHLTGYNVLPASAGRKQAFWSVEETFITMVFATMATTVEEAENEFTSEAHLLQTRRK